MKASDPNLPPSQARDDVGGRTGNSPLVPLDSIFNDNDASREEFSQRYMENVASYGQNQQNVLQHQDHYNQRQFDPGDQGSASLRYGFGDTSMRQGHPHDNQGHPASRGSWGSHAAGFPPRHGAAPGAVPNASQQQETWYGRDSNNSTTATNSSPHRQMLPQQQYDNNQYPMHGAGHQPARPPDGYPYSPRTSYGTGGGYHPNPYPLAGQNFPDHRSPDPRYGHYPSSYPPQYPGYGYPPQDSFYQQRSPHGGPYGRHDFMSGMGGGIPSQMAMGYSNIPFIKDINENDVLCGRGGATNSHSGNRSYRKLVKKFKDKYLKAKKKQKPSVAAEVVDIIRTLDPPGRFLKKDKDTGWYLDIGDARAKEKTSQALREGAPQIRKQMSEGKYNAEDDASDSSPEYAFSASPKSTEKDKDTKASVTDADCAVSPKKLEVDQVKSVKASGEHDEGQVKKEQVEEKVDEIEIEITKKRSSPCKSEDSGESPRKRQLDVVERGDDESPKKKGKNDELLREVFEPPRPNSISKGRDSDVGISDDVEGSPK